MNPSGRRGILIAIFRRKGRGGWFTNEFELLPEYSQSTLLRLAPMNSGELPVIGGLRSETDWFLLTTDRAVWGICGSVSEISHAEIWDAIPNLKKGFGITHKTILELPDLLVLKKNGYSHVVQLEPGEPLFGILHVLKNIGSRNRKASALGG